MTLLYLYLLLRFSSSSFLPFHHWAPDGFSLWDLMIPLQSVNFPPQFGGVRSDSGSSPLDPPPRTALGFFPPSRGFGKNIRGLSPCSHPQTPPLATGTVHRARSPEKRSHRYVIAFAIKLFCCRLIWYFEIVVRALVKT